MGEESWTRDEQDERFKREKGISNSFELAIDLIPTQILNIDPPTTIDCICFWSAVFPVWRNSGTATWLSLEAGRWPCPSHSQIPLRSKEVRERLKRHEQLEEVGSLLIKIVNRACVPLWERGPGGGKKLGIISKSSKHSVTAVVSLLLIHATAGESVYTASDPWAKVES